MDNAIMTRTAEILGDLIMKELVLHLTAKLEGEPGFSAGRNPAQQLIRASGQALAAR